VAVLVTALVLIQRSISVFGPIFVPIPPMMSVSTFVLVSVFVSIFVSLPVPVPLTIRVEFFPSLSMTIPAATPFPMSFFMPTATLTAQAPRVFAHE
jgi:hypothetical protein